MDRKIEKYIVDRLEAIKRNFENIDTAREEVIKLNRELINTTNKVMSAIYAGHDKTAHEYIKTLIKLYQEIEEKILSRETQPHEYSYYIKILKDGIKEYVETLLFYYYYKRIEPSKLAKFLENVPDDIFIEGLLDFVGELRRNFLEALKNREINKAEATLNLMNTIYKNLITTGLKSFFVKDFKHKLDIIKRMILRSMEDYIIVLYSTRRGE